MLQLASFDNEGEPNSRHVCTQRGRGGAARRGYKLGCLHGEEPPVLSSPPGPEMIPALCMAAVDPDDEQVLVGSKGCPGGVQLPPSNPRELLAPGRVRDQELPPDAIIPTDHHIVPEIALRAGICIPRRLAAEGCQGRAGGAHRTRQGLVAPVLLSMAP